MGCSVPLPGLKIWCDKVSASRSRIRLVQHACTLVYYTILVCRPARSTKAGYLVYPTPHTSSYKAMYTSSSLLREAQVWGCMMSSAASTRGSGLSGTLRGTMKRGNLTRSRNWWQMTTAHPPTSLLPSPDSSIRQSPPNHVSPFPQSFP